MPHAFHSPQNPEAPAPESLGSCPLNHGLAVVDQLLAAITRDRESALLDAALDFRLLLANSRDPTAVLRGYFVLRSVVEERHYLACYRLRRWLEQRHVALVQLDRSGKVRAIPVKLDVPSFGALYARCAVFATDGQPPRPWTRVQFARPASANADLQTSPAI